MALTPSLACQIHTGASDFACPFLFVHFHHRLLTFTFG